MMVRFWLFTHTFFKLYKYVKVLAQLLTYSLTITQVMGSRMTVAMRVIKKRERTIPKATAMNNLS